jgi:hypothetical protein
MKSIDLSAVDLNLLVAFEALYAEQSVTAAAQRLHVGQPVMSASLGRLRSLFADDLFVRVGRAMRPTAKADEIASKDYVRIKGVSTGAISISNSRLVALTIFSMILPLAKRMTWVSWKVMTRSLFGIPK